MTTPVLLTVSGYTVDGDGAGDSPIRLTTRGTLCCEDHQYTLEYDESQTDEDSGAILTQHIILRFRTNHVEMTRQGDFGTTMVFVRDKCFEGVYHTPYGELTMSVLATVVSIRSAAAKGSIHLQYQLSIQGQCSGLHDLRLDYRMIEAAP